ncbi:capsular polysaccharide export protein, LipB/KpsS family [Photobacterium iliopiscarium]|uniref:capsular polysaccharide export protein, LipB/KpsS family n=1 Tax=Photobacterium iliopiscarium TaxID=56192 RepID=UPI000D159F79|nr:hypothetical protein [Photobacterium iliopiscarium]PSU01217.1 hypothetical protein C9I85_03425 [Photobacterium iliopiscarium]PSV83872.1 hypothetical protein C9J51_07210 [Photobacterium iliopiscarium]
MKKVYFFIYSPFRIKLYESIATKYKEKGNDIYFVVQDLYSYFLIKRSWNNVILFRMKLDSKYTHSEINISQSIDILSEHVSFDVANKLSLSFQKLLNQLKLNENCLVFAGNGYHIQDCILKYYQEVSGFKIIFSELSNIDGKTFFDHKGSNASSYLYSFAEKYNNTEVLSAEKINKLNVWKKEYTKNKTCNHNVRQAKNKNIRDKIIWRSFNLLDYILNIPSFSVLKYKSNFPNRKSTAIKDYGSYLGNKGYYFLPLQVTDDSQIKINSDYNNKDAIKYYLEQSKNNGFDLVIKIHPAEKDQQFIKYIEELVENKMVFISSENTFKLMTNANKVCVINSTAGLEAILLDKDVEFLGRSFYSYLKNDSLLYYYIFEYLINIDFFSGLYSDDVFLEQIGERFGDK